MPLSPAQRLEIARRDRQVIELKSRGLTFDQIAKSGLKGVSHAQQAKRCFDRGLRNITQVAADQYRALENEKLDLLELELTRILTSKSEETKERTKAAQTLVSVYKRRADLNGIDAQPNDTATGIKVVLASSDVMNKTIRADDE